MEDIEYSDAGSLTEINECVEFHGMPEELMELLLQDMVVKGKVTLFFVPHS